MKTYLLRHPKAVEAQKSALAARSEPAAPAGGPVLLIGLDVHNDIAVSLASADSSEMHRYGIIGSTHDDVLKLCKKLQAAHKHHSGRY